MNQQCGSALRSLQMLGDIFLVMYSTAEIQIIQGARNTGVSHTNTNWDFESRTLLHTEVFFQVSRIAKANTPNVA